MKFSKPIAKSDLEKIFLESVEKDTPEWIKENKILDLNNKNEFTFTLKREHLKKFDPKNGGLGILYWFENYKEEAKISTAGIRGLQNPLYPWDTRYPLNLIGVMLATIGKVLVAQETGSKKEKVTACEVRYNSKEYVELIARIQAAYNIETHVTKDYQTIPIFLISFIIFMNDFYGGEYVTSSHAMCKKIATKDLNTQGSQYIPSESLKFVAKVEEILKETLEKGEYTIRIASDDNKRINREFLKSINNGIDDYIKYLKQAVATDTNISSIKNNKNKIVIDTVGGSLTNTFLPILKHFGIEDKFDFLHFTEDSFNHGVGKSLDAKKAFYDWSCDTTIAKADFATLDINLPVVNTVNYGTLLSDYPIGTLVLMTDPDADRLVTATVESASKIEELKKMGIFYVKLNNKRILVVFTPNQSFLMTMDFQQKALKNAGLWDKYNWFIVKTTASQRSWDEWALSNHIPVVNTPVGFKELADAMLNIERKMNDSKSEEIIIKDVFGNKINLGKSPRLLFAGEESGGEIFGASELITSKAGRKALSMREKSAGEAILITSAMISWLTDQNKTLADYLEEIFETNNIAYRYEIRIDQRYYNESEPDINILLEEKKKGMKIKVANNSFFLSLALGYKDGILKLDQIRQILKDAFADLDFSDLDEILFCGDGTYFKFKDKCLEVRPSGTDAVNKAYCYGKDQWENIKYSQLIAGYDGTRTKLHKNLIPEAFYINAENYSFDLYTYYKENQ